LAGALLATLIIGLISGGLVGGALAFLWATSRAEVTPRILPVPSLRPEGRPWLGITYRALTPAEAQRHSLSPTAGVLVLSVTADSPAEEGGLRANDIILTFDGKKVNEEATLLDLLTAKKPGDTVTLGILRGGQELSVNVTLGKRSDVRQGEGQRTLEDLLRELQRRFSGR